MATHFKKVKGRMTKHWTKLCKDELKKSLLNNFPSRSVCTKNNMMTYKRVSIETFTVSPMGYFYEYTYMTCTRYNFYKQAYCTNFYRLVLFNTATSHWLEMTTAFYHCSWVFFCYSLIQPSLLLSSQDDDLRVCERGNLRHSICLLEMENERL